jgi:hypothetical protein
VDNSIRQQKYESLYQEMKGRSGVKIDEAYFGSGAAGGTGAASPEELMVVRLGEAESERTDRRSL